MIGIENQDSSFLQVEVEDSGLPVSQDVISLSVTEEMHKIDSGTLTLFDPNHVYSVLLRVGRQLVISWGYKRADASPAAALSRQLNPDEFTGAISRRGLTAIVLSPGGSADSQGRQQYRCNFRAVNVRGQFDLAVFRSGTKASVVRQLLEGLGVTLVDVNFRRGNEVVTPDTEIRQQATTFRFLSQIAFEWGALFRISHTPDGQLAACFIDPWRVKDTPFTRLVTGATSGGSAFFDYGGAAANVRQYNWQDHAGESGIGDAVQIVFQDGKPTFVKYTVEDERVKGWRLKPERIQDELKRRGLEAGFQGQMELLREWAEAKTFEQIKGFFEPIESGAAPQGLGYTVQLQTLGNTLNTAPLIAQFGDGFPAMIENSKLGKRGEFDLSLNERELRELLVSGADVGNPRGTTFYVRKVSHTISRSGYHNAVEIVDAFRLNPATGQVFV